MLRKLRYGALLPILASMALLANSAPSGAAATLDAVGAGVVVGLVRVLPPPGIPSAGLPCKRVTFLFVATELAGAIVSLDSAVPAVGTLNVLARGGFDCAVAQGAGGTVLVFLITPAVMVSGSILLCKEDALLAGGGFKPGLNGTAVRVGPVVIVDIAGDLNIDRSGEEDCEEADLTVAALFIPNPPQQLLPRLPGIRTATFVGVFAVLALGDSADGDAGDPT